MTAVVQKLGVEHLPQAGGEQGSQALCLGKTIPQVFKGWLRLWKLYDDLEELLNAGLGVGLIEACEKPLPVRDHLGRGEGGHCAQPGNYSPKLQWAYHQYISRLMHFSCWRLLLLCSPVQPGLQGRHVTAVK